MQPREVLGLDEIDLSDREFWVRPLDEREGAFQTLRRERPVSFHAEPDLGDPAFPPGPGYWAITRHADVLEASRSPERFCSGRGTNIGDLPQPFLEFFGSMINMDDPRHARLRRIVSQSFTPRTLSRVQADVETLADEIIDRVIGRGSCDFVTDVAARLPLALICRMMGISESDYQMVFDRTNVILGAGDPDYTPETDVRGLATALLQAASDLTTLVQGMAAERRESPRDDLTSAMATAEVDGDRLSDSEIGSFFVLLVVAGNETTRNAISHGMKALCDHPEQRRRWVADFEALAPPAIEEIVRWATPVIHFRRTVVEDTELGGQKLRAGEKVVLFYSSANRDEREFEEPFRFDVTRQPNEHVGFGGPGPHFCLGAHLARREIHVMFDRLFRRLPDLEISGPPDRLASNFIHGIKRMPCSFTPRGSR